MTWRCGPEYIIDTIRFAFNFDEHQPGYMLLSMILIDASLKIRSQSSLGQSVCALGEKWVSHRLSSYRKIAIFVALFTLCRIVQEVMQVADAIRSSATTCGDAESSETHIYGTSECVFRSIERPALTKLRALTLYKDVVVLRRCSYDHHICAALVVRYNGAQCNRRSGFESV